MWPATQWETEKKTFPSRCHGEDVRSCWFILSKTRAYVRSCSSACLDPLVTHEPDVLTPKPPKPFLTDSQKVNILVQHSAYILVCILFCFFFFSALFMCLTALKRHLHIIFHLNATYFGFLHSERGWYKQGFSSRPFPSFHLLFIVHTFINVSTVSVIIV